MNPLDWLGVAMLGGAGAIGRFLLDGAISSKLRRDFPYGTFAVNISGAFVLGLLDGLALTGTALTLIGTATIGSYTTFSTWMLETHRLREDSEFRPAVANIVISLLAGLAAAAFGHLVGAWL
jgi:fluoride exporter